MSDRQPLDKLINQYYTDSVDGAGNKCQFWHDNTIELIHRLVEMNELSFIAGYNLGVTE